MAGKAYTSNAPPSQFADERTQLDYFVRSITSKIATATIVRVIAVDTSAKTVDVNPLVHQVDGAGQITPHGNIHQLPYARLQSGVNAIIIDPQVGDIGVVVFASRDISSAVQAKKPSQPGSLRQHDMADGMYILSICGQAPQNYIKIDNAGAITINTGQSVTVNASQVVANCDVIANGISLQNHTHTDPQGGTTGAPQ